MLPESVLFLACSSIRLLHLLSSLFWPLSTIDSHFVYTWLLEHPDKAQRFLYSAWQRSATTAIFFDRIVHDYSYLLNKNAKQWELILPDEIPTLKDAAWFYATLLVNATYHCSIAEELERQIHLLNELAAGHPDVPEIVIEFANGLVNLSNKQDAQSARDTIARLESLVAEHPNVLEIALCLLMDGSI